MSELKPDAVFEIPGTPDWKKFVVLQHRHPPSQNGNVTKVPLKYEGGLHRPGWDREGRIVSIGYPLHATLWRFQPVK